MTKLRTRNTSARLRLACMTGHREGCCVLNGAVVGMSTCWARKV